MKQGVRLNLIKRFMKEWAGECDRTELFRFGISLGIVLLIWGNIFVLKGKGGEQYFFSVAALLFLGSSFIPYALCPLYSISKAVLRLLNLGVSTFILLVAYYLVVTPIAWGMRWRRWKFLDLRFRTGDTTYWLPSLRNPSRQSYEKQF